MGLFPRFTYVCKNVSSTQPIGNNKKSYHKYFPYFNFNWLFWKILKKSHSIFDKFFKLEDRTMQFVLL